MIQSQTIPNWLEPSRVGRWGRGALIGSFLFLALLWFALTWTMGAWVAVLPALLLGGAGALYLLQKPILNLYVVLAGFVVVADFEEGSSAIEILYALYYALFLGVWFFRYRYVEGRQILRSALDVGVMFFLVWVTASFGLTVINNADLVAAAGEWMAVLMLASYFPIREAVSTERSGPDVIAGIIIWLGLFVTVRNLFWFGSDLGNATMLWEVMLERVTTNMTLLLLSCLFLLILLAYEKKWQRQIPLFLAFLGTLMSLVLTQARAFWIDFAFGAGIVFLLVGWNQKKRLLSYGAAGAAGALVAGFILLGDTLWILMVGLVDRLVSITTATETDVSLINRFYEAGYAFEHISDSPIIGHGLATEYRAFDQIIYKTISKPFAHIGFVLLWFKYGLIGMLAVLFFWMRGAWTGFTVFNNRLVEPRFRTYALAAFVGLAALLPSAFTSVPFYLSDSLLGYALLLGLCEGLRRRSHEGALPSYDQFSDSSDDSHV